MFAGCARIGVAVSGGADSVALLHALRQLYPDCSLSAVHLNHCLRGTESDLDEQFVRDLAASLGVGLFVRRENVAGAAAAGRRNLENAGRRCRYRFFGQLVEQGK